MKDKALFSIELALSGFPVEKKAVLAAKEAAHPKLFTKLYLLRWWWHEDEELLHEAIEACRPTQSASLEVLFEWALTTDIEKSLEGRTRLWELGSAEIFERAAKMSQDEDWYKREKAAEILEGLGGPNLPFRARSRPILERLLADRDKDVVAAAARAMTAAKDPNLITELLRLKHHPSIEVRVAVADGLAGAEGLDVREALLDMLCARERQVRIAAALSLSTLPRNHAIVKPLIGLRRDSDPRVRGAAVYSLALLEVDQSAQFVNEELAQNEVDRYTIWAARHLGKSELYEGLLSLKDWIDMDVKLLYETLFSCDEVRAAKEELEPRTTKKVIEDALAAEDKPKAIGSAVRILAYRQDVECYYAAQELRESKDPMANRFGVELEETMLRWPRGEDCVACGKYWFSDVFARLAKWDWRRRIFTRAELDDFCRRQLNSHWSGNPPVCTDGVHVMCVDIAKLHEFASVIGLSPRLFTNHEHHPHYDLMTLDARHRALETGAIPMSSKELLRTFSSGRLRGRVRTLFRNWDRTSPTS